jgi:DNA-binding response OmpR family regulator
MIALDKRLLDIEILFVEDDNVLNSIVTDALTMIGFKLESAKNGLEGLNLFKCKKFDLVLSDINMPEMDGLQMSREIRNLNKKIPIILLSAHNEASYLLDSISIGINGYLVKPAQIKELVAQIAKVMEPVFLLREFDERGKQWSHDALMVYSMASNIKSKLNSNELDQEFFSEYLDKIVEISKSLASSITKLQDR